MIGRASAPLERVPRRWMQSAWGLPDINARQKWMAVWPHLASLERDGVRLLDAGCGEGVWALEIATRRPGWSVTGIDRDAASIARAETARTRLGRTNAAFETADFLGFEPAGPFDVVLSVASAHYLAEAGAGEELFSRFREWLRPGGLLVLLGPRRVGDVPQAIGLMGFGGHDLFTRDDLIGLCRTAGIRVEVLAGVVGRMGIAAKRLRQWSAGGKRAHRVLTYPAQWMLSCFDAKVPATRGQGTCAWLLTARA